ncbi:hypothetical protein [Microvirga vignae]|uniref:hypothetical protein n=1 Tax=Microvirga vignae TaxID=1225564 RepID=UPI00069A389F|nr:hypothetical protein [Microvirga vignae]
MSFPSAPVVDIHCHVFNQVTRVGIDLAMMPETLRPEVLMDAGSAGPDAFDSFAEWANVARSEGWGEVYGLVNVSRKGLDVSPEITEVADFQPERAADAAVRHPKVARGLKLRAIQPALRILGLELVERSVRAAEQAGLPVMVHFGQQDGTYREEEMLTSEILDRLRPGDIASHLYTAQSGGVFASERNFEAARRARKRGVLFDIGHGRFNFDIDAARAGFERGFPPDFISSDVTSGTAEWLSLPYAMSAVSAAGFSDEMVIEAVTSAPGKWLGIDRKARKVIESRPCEALQQDSSGNRYSISRRFAIVAVNSSRTQRGQSS